MNAKYNQVSNQLVNNFSLLKASFKWDEDLSKWLLAVAYATQEKEITIEAIQEMKAYIKKTTGMFSPFKSMNLLSLSGLLALNSENAKSTFDVMNDNYKTVKNVGFKQTTYLPLALYTLSQVYEGSDYTQYAEQAINIYKEMKSNHPILTGGDDYALAILMVKEQGKLDRIERAYQALKSAGFSSTNGLQMMSHILTFSDESVEILVERASEIASVLKSNKLKIYPDYYASIALIALVGSASATQDLVDVALYIKSQKQARWLSKGMVVMLASAIVTTELVESTDEVVLTSLKVSIQSIIAAQQAAMIAAIAASSAAAGASS